MYIALLTFLTFTAVFFWAVIINHNYKAAIRIVRKWLGKSPPPVPDKVQAMIESLKAGLGEAIKKAHPGAKVEFIDETRAGRLMRGREKPKETHTFQWRKDGKMNEVKIIIDPALDTVIAGTQEEFQKLVKTGDSGSLEELLNTLTKADGKKKLNEVEEFVFSPQSVEQMKIAGTSPDELVAKMLKAAGRMD